MIYSRVNPVLLPAGYSAFSLSEATDSIPITAFYQNSAPISKKQFYALSVATTGIVVNPPGDSTRTPLVRPLAATPIFRK